MSGPVVFSPVAGSFVGWIEGTDGEFACGDAFEHIAVDYESIVELNDSAREDSDVSNQCFRVSEIDPLF